MQTNLEQSIQSYQDELTKVKDALEKAEAVKVDTFDYRKKLGTIEKCFNEYLSTYKLDEEATIRAYTKATYEIASIYVSFYRNPFMKEFIFQEEQMQQVVVQPKQMKKTPFSFRRNKKTTKRP